MRLFLIRHGETESNRLGLTLGRADVPLNEHGRWQAQRLAEALAAEPLAAIYSSPLSRTRDTAAAIARQHNLEIQIEPDLTEMDIGETEGLLFADLRARFPGLLETWASPQGPTQPMPGGERLIDVRTRAWQTIQAITSRHPEETACAVTHNFVILSLLTIALGIELADFRNLRHSVGAISILEFNGERVRLLRLNDTCHMDSGG
ncbi:MAG: histidine phosphatase family protein [Dehalococcoidia bacterium]